MRVFFKKDLYIILKTLKYMIVNAEIMFASFEMRLAWTVNEEKVYDKLEKEKYIYQELNTICLK